MWPACSQVLLLWVLGTWWDCIIVRGYLVPRVLWDVRQARDCQPQFHSQALCLSMCADRPMVESNRLEGQCPSVLPHILNLWSTLTLVSRKLHFWIPFLHQFQWLHYPQSQYTPPSPITWLEDEDFFLSVLESVLLSVLQSFLSLDKLEPSKLDFDLGK